VYTTQVATVVVHVDDAGFRGDGLRDLVGVARGGDAGADVEELADPRFAGQVADRPAEERPVGVGTGGQVGIDLQPGIGGRPVSGVVGPCRPRR
jgi:hypothetical protein